MIEKITTWIKQNPGKAILIGAAIGGGVYVATNPKTQKQLGLGSAPPQRKRPYRRKIKAKNLK